jgi:lycopene beta-cyclase
VTSSYDFVLAGAGAAGLSLAVHLIQSGKFRDKQILLIDRDDKKKNDRTWCFWEEEPGPFEEVVSHRWKQAWFHGQDESKKLGLDPFTYKLIRGLDFYQYCFSLLKNAGNVEFVRGEIEDLRPGEGHATCRVGEKHIKGTYIFSSMYEKPIIGKGEHYLLQHFLGWRLRTSTPVFDPAEPVLMDFRVSQDQGTSFVYVLPFSPFEALVEYTMFSERVMDRNHYEEGLQRYMSENFPSAEYNIEEEEFGVIPMTDHKFPPGNGNIVYIGTAAGQTKASTGYTFSFIQKHSRAIVECLAGEGHPSNVNRSAARFAFYDRTFLEVLERKKLAGHRVFERLFMKNPPARILRFLNNESAFSEELSLLASLPTIPFLKAALKIK